MINQGTQQNLAHYGYRILGFVINQEDIIMTYNLKDKDGKYAPIALKLIVTNNVHQQQIQALSNLFFVLMARINNTELFNLDTSKQNHSLLFEDFDSEVLKGQDLFGAHNFNIEFFGGHVVSDVIIIFTDLLYTIILNYA